MIDEDLINALLKIGLNSIEYLKGRKGGNVELEDDVSISFEYTDEEEKKELQFIIIKNKPCTFIVDVKLIRSVIYNLSLAVREGTLSAEDLVIITDVLAKFQSKFYN